MSIKYSLKLIGATAALIIVVFLLTYIFPVFKNALYNIDFALKGSTTPESVAVVGVDSRSLADIGGWPWKRERIAELLDSIGAAGPSVTAVDMIFPERSDSAGNKALRESLKGLERVVGGFRVDGAVKGEYKGSVTIPVEAYSHRFMEYMSPSESEYNMIYSAKSISIGDNKFASTYSDAGFINVSANASDQNLRSIVHAIGVGREYYPSIAVAAVSEYLDVPDEKVFLDFSGRIIVGDREIDLDPVTGSVPLNYYGKTGSVDIISASDVLRGKGKERLRDKLVFLGITDATSGAADFFITPVGNQFPGVEVWATASANIIEEDMFVSHGIVDVLNFFLVLVLFPGLCLLLHGKGRKPVLVTFVACVALSIALNPVLFKWAGIFWDPTGHIVSAGFLLAWITLYGPGLRIVYAESLNLEPDEAEMKELKAPLPNMRIRKIPELETAEYAFQVLSKRYSNEECTEKFSELAGGRIIKPIGTGGMSDVYLVWNPKLEVYRAVKVIKPGRLKDSGERFETEIKIAANLSHTNIVGCYGTGTWCGLSYIEMEYVRGVSFGSIIRGTESMSLEETAGVCILVCRALHYAHRRTVSVHNKQYSGVVHRDIKPANILFCRSGKIKITDFGIARPGALNPDRDDSRKVFGTLPYISPEQLKTSEATPKSDLYSLGTTLYEMISGEKAFPQNDIQSLISAKEKGHFEPLSELLYGDMAGIINRAMSLNQEDRFNDAVEMSVEAERVLRDVITDKNRFVFQELLTSVFPDRTDS